MNQKTQAAHIIVQAAERRHSLQASARRARAKLPGWWLRQAIVQVIVQNNVQAAEAKAVVQVYALDQLSGRTLELVQALYPSKWEGGAR